MIRYFIVENYTQYFQFYISGNKLFILVTNTFDHVQIKISVPISSLIEDICI